MLFSSRCAVALAIGLVAACGSKARPMSPGERAIGSIDLKGAASVDDDDLRGGLGLVYAREHGQPFARFLVAQDRLRIEGYYVRRGFLGVEVEQAVVRRVLLPADFGAPAELAARGERVASMPLALDAAQAASLPPVAGYRLVAFYP